MYIRSSEEKTPELHRSFEPEEKELNQLIGTEVPQSCYFCSRPTDGIVVVSPYPPTNKSMNMVKPYRIPSHLVCAIDCGLLPKVPR